jgi:hypothetical protein
MGPQVSLTGGLRVGLPPFPPFLAFLFNVRCRVAFQIPASSLRSKTCNKLPSRVCTYQDRKTGSGVGNGQRFFVVYFQICLDLSG